MASPRFITISRMYCDGFCADIKTFKWKSHAKAEHNLGHQCDSNDFEYVSVNKVPVFKVADEIMGHLKLTITSDDIIIQTNIDSACGLICNQSCTARNRENPVPRDNILISSQRRYFSANTPIMSATVDQEDMIKSHNQSEMASIYAYYSIPTLLKWHWPLWKAVYKLHKGPVRR